MRPPAQADAVAGALTTNIPATSGLRPSSDAAPAYAWTVLGAMLVVMAYGLFTLDWPTRWLAGLLILLTMFTVFFPTATRRRHPVLLPMPLELSIAAFAFAALFLGEIMRFYDRFWWWDLVLHTSSGILLSALGLLFAYGIAGRSLRPRLAFLFAPMLAMSIGTIWEIFEFAIEKLFGVHMQTPRISGGSGLDDTMWDLIVNAGAAILVAAYGWHCTRPSRKPGAPAWVERFLQTNEAFFQKRWRRWTS